MFYFYHPPPPSHFWRLGTSGQSDKHLILLYVPFQPALHFGLPQFELLSFFVFRQSNTVSFRVCHAAHFYSVRKQKKQIQKCIASHQKILSSCLFISLFTLIKKVCVILSSPWRWLIAEANLLTGLKSLFLIQDHICGHNPIVKRTKLAIYDHPSWDKDIQVSNIQTPGSEMQSKW